MTVAEKIALLKNLFREYSSTDILSWTVSESGCRWTCRDHHVAAHLAGLFFTDLSLMHVDVSTFPHHYEHENVLLIEPVADPT